MIVLSYLEKIEKLAYSFIKGMGIPIEEFISKSQEHLYIDGIVSCPYTEKNVIKDILILVQKNELITTI